MNKIRVWLCHYLNCPPPPAQSTRHGPVSDEVRVATHDLRTAAVRLQSAANQIRKEADVITGLVKLMHGATDK